MPDHSAPETCRRAAGGDVVLGYDRRPLAEGELDLAALPAEAEAELKQVEQRVAAQLAEALGVPVEVEAAVRFEPAALPLAEGGDCSPAACAGPCDPPAHTSYGRGEALFTLAEAEQELAERLCAREGHDLDIIDTQTIADRYPRPVAIMCRRKCQFRGYRVVPIGEIDLAELLTAALLDLWADLGRAYDDSPADPRESSVECRGLITRIVDISRTLGTVPAEVVPPNLVASGVYVEVHRLAGHVATVAPCTMATAVDAYAELLAERDLAGDGRPAEGGGDLEAEVEGAGV